MKDLLIGAIFGGIITWIGQWLFYRYQKRDEKRQGPVIVISRVIQDELFLVELRNTGSDSLTEMEVKARWQKDGQEEEQLLNKFFSGQYTYGAPGTHVEILGPSDRYFVAGLPQITQDGLVDIHVSGLGANSQQLYKTASQIVVGLTPKNRP